MIGSVVRLTHHAREVMRRREIGPGELCRALGTGVVDDEGRLALPTVIGGATPAIAQPIAIGRQRRDRHRTNHVLLASTGARELIVVVSPDGPRAALVITVWDPADPAHAGWWQPDNLLPTDLGRRHLPPTHWHASGAYDSIRRAERCPHRDVAPAAKVAAR